MRTFLFKSFHKMSRQDVAALRRLFPVAQNYDPTVRCFTVTPGGLRCIRPWLHVGRCGFTYPRRRGESAHDI